MSGSDKRRRPRTPVSGPLLVVTRAGARIHGHAIDVSLLGFRFSAEELLAAGERVSTTLKFPNGTLHEISGDIKFVVGGSPYQYGVAFTEETTERVIKSMIKVA